VPIRLVIAVLARVILLAAMSCLFWSTLPTLWGWTATTVMSDSMAPLVRTGDIIVTMPVTDPTASLGRVILFEDPDHPDRLRLHRLVGVTPDGRLTTRGDANATTDSSPIAADDVEGLAVIRTPALGLPFVWVREGRWELLLAGTALALGLGVLAVGARTHRTEPERGVTRIIPPALSVTAAALIATVVGSSGTAHAAYAAQSPTPVSTLVAHDTFGCLVLPALDSPDVLYRLNEAAGVTALDASGNDRVGTLLADTARESGACTSSSPSLALTGSISSGITVSGDAMAPSNIFSVEIWFRTTSVRGGQLIGFGESPSGSSAVADRRIWMTNGGVLRFSIRHNNAVRTISAPGTFNDGAWHHTVATLSSSGMRLYVDGILQASNPSFRTAYHYQPFGSDGYWRVGGDTTAGMPTATDTTLAASIDNAAVYFTSALGASRIAAHFAAGR
jgi:signal peptidase I